MFVINKPKRLLRLGIGGVIYVTKAMKVSGLTVNPLFSHQANIKSQKLTLFFFVESVKVELTRKIKNNSFR
jgi:hypothetical protein